MAVTYSQGRHHDKKNETRAMVEEAIDPEAVQPYQAPRYRTAAHQILNNPYLRRRLIAHEPVINEDGTWDYHAGRELNPPGSERLKYGPRRD